jgi:ATP-binding cassette subfamily B protein
MRRLAMFWKLIAGERWRYAGAVLALIIASATLYAIPIIPQIVIDGVLGGDEGHVPTIPERIGLPLLGGATYLAGHLWVAGLAIVAVATVAGFFTYLRGRFTAVAAENVIQRLRDRVHDHLNHAPCTWHDNSETGDTLQRATSDIDTLRTFLALQVVDISRAVAMLLIPIPIMLMVDVGMTIASVSMVPFIVIFAPMFYGRIRDEFRKKDEAEGRMTATVQENLTGIRVVRAFARQEFEREKFRERNDLHRKLDMRLYSLVSRFWALSDLLCFTQKAIVLILGGWWVAAGTLEVGAFYFFLAAVTMFIWPVRMLGRLLSEMGKAVVAIDRINEILDVPLETQPLEPLDITGVTGSIDFADVTFAHEESAPILQNVSFTIVAGETLAIVGPSGCGKSTIVNLLLRLYDVDGGHIGIGGHDITTMDRTDLRRLMAVVMQEPFLYSRSIRDNLAIGRRKASEDELFGATRAACVHDTILQFDEGYETVVGERGVTLSGGQRQRVAIARALLQDPLILILDDALSAVDTRTEELILEAMRTRHGHLTTVVIAHRLSTLTRADRVLVMEHGKIIQEGRHEELIGIDGMYRRLWDIQTRLEAVEDSAGRGGVA